jgi:hypothetical protein
MLLPPSYPEVGPRPALRELLGVQIDMQLADLSTLLRMPRDEPGLGAGCKLTAATLPMNVIAGASVLFWKSSIESLEQRAGRGKRFKDLMRAKYPQSADDAVDAEFAAELMWDYTRAPHTHALGVGKTAQLLPGIPREERGVWTSKAAHGLPADVVDQLMSSCERLEWLDPTIAAEPRGYAVHVGPAGVGVTRMLRDRFADDVQSDAAEATAGAASARRAERRRHIPRTARPERPKTSCLAPTSTPPRRA